MTWWVQPIRPAAAYLFKRSRTRHYLTRAAGILASELETPGGLDDMDACFRAAGKLAADGLKLKLKDLLIGSDSIGHFKTRAEAIAKELPAILRQTFPETKLPDDEEIRYRCIRALQAAVAASEEDPVARRVLELGGQGAGTVREHWGLLTATISTTAVAGVASGLGVGVATHSTAAGLVAGIVAAGVAATGTGGAFGYIETGHIQTVHTKLRRLVDAVLRHNAPGYHLPTYVERMRPYPLSSVIGHEMERIVDHTRLPKARLLPGQRRGVIYTWDGDQRAAIKAAEDDFFDCLARIRPNPDWPAPNRLGRSLSSLLASGKPDREPLEAELVEGSTAFEILASCAAIAVELDNALGLPVIRAA